MCIAILDFPFFTALEGNHHWFELRNGRDPTYVLTRDLGLHYIELTRPPKEYTALQDWAQLIENAGKEDTDMSTLLSKNPNLERAYEEYRRCTQDQELRDLALARERYQRDHASRIGAARREGIAEGIMQEREEGARRTARRMFAAGMDASTVAEILDLPEAEVAKMAENGDL